MKLTLEEKDDLQELVTHPGMKALWKEVDAAVQLIEDEVLKLTLTGPDDEKNLIYKKCRADGAAQLADAIKRRLKPAAK